MFLEIPEGFLALGRMLTMLRKQDSCDSRPAQRRQDGDCRRTEKQKGAFGDALLSCLCGVQPRVVDFDPPLCSPEEFRAMHYRKHVKGQQVSYLVDQELNCSPSGCQKALKAKREQTAHRSVNCEGTDKCAEHGPYAITSAVKCII